MSNPLNRPCNLDATARRALLANVAGMGDDLAAECSGFARQRVEFRQTTRRRDDLRAVPRKQKRLCGPYP